MPVAYVEQGVSTHPDNLAILEHAEVVILAVKPAQMLDVLTQISEAIPADALVVSVAAGITLTWLAKHCRKQQALVRCMPNIAVIVDSHPANIHFHFARLNWDKCFFTAS